MPAMGIYAIHHLPSGKRYVGSSEDYKGRFRAHRYLLRHGKHHSPQLQRTFDRDGEATISFELIEEVQTIEALLFREQFHIDAFKAYDGAFGYNVAEVAGTRRGVRQPKSVAENQRKLMKGKPKSEAHRAAIGAARRGMVVSDQQKAKARENAKAQWADPVKRAQMLDGFKNRERSDEDRAAASGRAKAQMTPEARANLAAKARERWADPEMRETYIRTVKAGMEASGAAEKISAAKKGVKFSAEVKAKMSASQKAAYAADPDLKTKRSAQLRVHAAKRAEDTKGKPMSEEHRLKLIEGQRRAREAKAAQ